MSLTIRCTFSNTSNTSTVSWTIDGQPVTDGSVTTTATSSELMLSRFLSEGIYTCRVVNQDGRSASSSIQLYGSLDSKCLPTI